MAPKKFSFMSGLLFWGFCSLSLSLSLFFRRRRLFVFVVFKRENSGLTGHTPPRTVLVLFFSFLSPPHLVSHPFWPCVLSFSRFVGVPFWAPGVFWILLELTGLAPSEALFGREAARVFGFFSCLCCFPVCGIHTLAGRAGS